MGHGGGIIKIKHNQIYALLFTMCMVVAVIPMAGAVADQNSEKNIIKNTNANQDLKPAITSEEAQNLHNTIEDKKPFGANTEKVIAKTNLVVNTESTESTN